MLPKSRILFSLLLFFACLSFANDKKNASLPDYVLNARNVLVLIDPDAGVSVDTPLANKTALEDVEKAIMKWGRFHLVQDTQTADLIVVVKKGSNKTVQPTIRGVPTGDRPVIVEPTDDGIRVAGKRGQPPGSTQPSPQETSPHPGVEVGSSEDIFSVYNATVARPLDAHPVWRYTAKDALRSPSVPAVAEFRKAIEQSEKKRKSKP